MNSSCFCLRSARIAGVHPHSLPASFLDYVLVPSSPRVCTRKHSLPPHQPLLSSQHTLSRSRSKYDTPLLQLLQQVGRRGLPLSRGGLSSCQGGVLWCCGGEEASFCWESNIASRTRLGIFVYFYIYNMSLLRRLKRGNHVCLF